MKFTTAIRQIMKDKKVTQTILASQLGINQSSFSMKLKRNNITLSTFTDILDKLGYEVVIQPKKQGRRATGQIVIDDGE